MKKNGVSPSQFYGLWVERYSAVKTSILRDLNRTESQEMVMSTIASLKHMDLKKKNTLTKNIRKSNDQDSEAEPTSVPADDHNYWHRIKDLFTS